MTLQLSSPPRVRLTIERGGKQAIVRVFFTDALERRSCLDSRLMDRAAAIRMAKRIARDGTEVEVVAYRYKMVRPPPWQVRRTKRLDEHRLNKVPGLRTCAEMFMD